MAQRRRGFATGVFGAGMGGTALSAFCTPRLVTWFGYVVTHVIVAVALAGTAVIVLALARDAPGGAPNTSPVIPQLAAAARLRVTWEMSALYAAAQPAPEIPAGLTFLAMAFVLGIDTGGVFAWVAQRVPAERIGAVTGIIGAAGGLDGFFPQLVMGATYDQAGNNYTVGLALLCVTAAVALLVTLLRIPHEAPATRR